MHNRALHDSLAAFVQEAAWQLAEEVSGGAEIPFELDATPTRSAPLYCYRPLTGQFIAQRAGMLPGCRATCRPPRASRRCPTCPAYLAKRGRRAPAARAARRRAAGVPRRGLGGRHRLRVRRAALRGRLRRARGDRLRRLRAERRDHARRGPRDRVRRGAARRRAERSSRGDDARRRAARPAATTRTRPSPCSRWSSKDGRALEHAGRRLRRLQTALRLWDDAEPALGPTAYARTDGSRWMAIPLGDRPAPPERGLPAEHRGRGPAARVLRPRHPPHAARGRAGVGAAALRARLRARQRRRGADGLAAGREGAVRRRRPLTATTASPSGSPRSAPSAATAPALEARVREAISLERAAMAGFVRAVAGGRGARVRARRLPAGGAARRALRPPRPGRCARSPTSYASSSNSRRRKRSGASMKARVIWKWSVSSYAVSHRPVVAQLVDQRAGIREQDRRVGGDHELRAGAAPGRGCRRISVNRPCGESAASGSSSTKSPPSRNRCTHERRGSPRRASARAATRRRRNRGSASVCRRSRSSR